VRENNNFTHIICANFLDYSALFSQSVLESEKFSMVASLSHQEIPNKTIAAESKDVRKHNWRRRALERSPSVFTQRVYRSENEPQS